MTGEFGEMDGGDRKEPKPDESIYDFYLRLTQHEKKDSTIRIRNAAYTCLTDFIIDRFKKKVTDQNSNVIQDKIDEKLIVFDSELAQDWVKWMVEEYGLQASSAAAYLDSICQMINILKQDNYITGQERPFEEARDNFPYEYNKESDWPEISFAKFALEVKRTAPIRDKTIVLLLAKTGIRLGTIVNLDERDVHINHPISHIKSDPRAEIADKPNTLYVDSSINKGEVNNGEERAASIKGSSTRIIPLDEETIDCLGFYLSCRQRPDGAANPLLGKYANASRLSRYLIGNVVDRFESKFDIHEDKSISPHYFRHWYVTQVRNNLSMVEPEKYPGTPSRIVKGLRGDSDDDTIDTYSHDWNKGLEADVPPTDDLIRDCVPNLFTKG